MPRQKVVRTPSQEIMHRAEIRQRNAERQRKRRSEQTEEQRKAENERQKRRMSDKRQQLSEDQREQGNETARTGMQNLRSNLTLEEQQTENENARVRMQNLRAELTVEAQQVERENARVGMQNLRANFDDQQIRSAQVALRLRMQLLRRNKDSNLCAGGFEVDDNAEQHYGGTMDLTCEHCMAKHFDNETVANKGLSFSGCCQHGTVTLNIPPYPEELKPLFAIAEFRKDIRLFNSIHSFGSFNADIVNFGINRPGPYAFVVQGQIYYQINTALQNDTQQPKSHAQLYIVDPQEAAENRLAIFNNLNPDITKTLSTILSQINEQGKAFKMLYEEVEMQKALREEMGLEPLNLSLHFGIKPGQDQRRFNLQASNEVAAVFSTTDDGEIPDSYITIYDKNEKKLKTVNPASNDLGIDLFLHPHCIITPLLSIYKDVIEDLSLLSCNHDKVTIACLIDQAAVSLKSQFLILGKDDNGKLIELYCATKIGAILNERWQFSGKVVIEGGCDGVITMVVKDCKKI